MLLYETVYSPTSVTPIASIQRSGDHPLVAIFIYSYEIQKLTEPRPRVFNLIKGIIREAE